MKREILFRGKRVDNVDWIEGFYVHFENFLVKYVIYSDEHLYKEVNAETIGQFTGLTDKNGNKIFEGDICEWNGWGRNRSVVEFCDGLFGLKQKYHKHHPVGRKYEWRDMSASGEEDLDIEVIGNIHDNPELLR